jgi:ABC-type dipeptide/oligopeptide/nickel transport system permease subunit
MEKKTSNPAFSFERPITTLSYPSRQSTNRFLRSPLRSLSGTLGLLIVLLVVGSAIFADQIAPFAPTEGDLLDAKIPPMWQEGGTSEHLLGTDTLGQDIFSRIIYGSRVSVTVGFFGVLLAATIGVTAGLLAGYLGGWVDSVTTSAVNLMLSIPYLVLVIVIAAIFGRSLINVILIFGITDAPIFVRLTRGEVMRLKHADYVESARGLGASPWRIIFLHILPNLIGPLITLATFEMSAMIFYESGLSFLGLSVPPEVPSWGNMLTVGRRYLNIYPWIAIYPGVAIAITALGVNLLGDWLRDTLDPRLQRSRA